MANLFTDDLSQVTLLDVEQFLNLQAPTSLRVMEGPRLDFKKDVPQDLGWHVAGLANRYGGILLVGVEKDKTKKNVPASLPGTDLGNDPRARLTDRILASIHPRPDFEVQPIAMSDPRRGTNG
jgi:predicted HTH transcriptional regulator